MFFIKDFNLNLFNNDGTGLFIHPFIYNIQEINTIISYLIDYMGDYKYLIPVHAMLDDVSKFKNLTPIANDIEYINTAYLKTQKIIAATEANLSDNPKAQKILLQAVEYCQTSIQHTIEDEINNGNELFKQFKENLQNQFSKKEIN